MLDDRDERPGVKFKDADLLGLPVRVTIGNAFVKEGLVEVRSRKTRQESRVPKDKVVDAIRAIHAAEARRQAGRASTTLASALDTCSIPEKSSVPRLF